MNPGATRAVFMGSPAFAMPSLQALLGAGYNVAAAVTQPDRPAGRGGRVAQPEVKAAALAAGVPVLQPESLKDPETQARLAALVPDLLVVAAYGKILPRAVLAIPRRGSVNVHASLLPRWRGASPIAAAILAGDAETGVSIMEMAFKMDAGDVIAQAAIPIAATATTGTLERELAALGARLLIDALPDWYDGRHLAVPQDERLVTTCGLVRKEDGHLRATMTAAEAERAIRAFDPWPGAYIDYRGARLGIWRAHVPASYVEAAIGAMLIMERKPALALPGGLLVLDEVQRTGARRITGEQFLNGERGVLAQTAGLA
ncbi:MAG: methionyl-tRNA formyltransferase [Chloroflexi bacterium]|nr:methionyl-tRNA formyltransferase [Chloroflexota bacterium]